MRKFLSLLMTAILSVGMMSAATTRIYCKNAQSWWFADGAGVNAYCYLDNDNKMSEWPGTAMTAVEGEENMWYIDVDATAYPNIIFVRAIGSVDGNAQTADLVIPTDGNNLYTITSDEPKWHGDGNNVTGEWSVYTPTPVVEPEPEPVKYYITGTVIEGSTDEDWKRVEMSAGNGDTMMVDITLAADSLYMFKVVKEQGEETTWYGVKVVKDVQPWKAMEYGDCTGWWLISGVEGQNIGLQSTKAGTYTFIFEKNENNIISVVIPEPDPVVEPEPTMVEIRLVPNIWNVEGVAAKFAAVTWKEGQNILLGEGVVSDWFVGTDTVVGLIPEDADYVAFARFKGETVTPTLDMSAIWNHSDMLTIDPSMIYTISAWEEEKKDFCRGYWGEAPVTKYYLVGEMTNWEADKVEFVDGVVSMNITEAKTYEMKVLSITGEEKVFYSADGELTKDNCTNWVLYGDVAAAIRLVVETAGDYTFSWNADTKTLNVTYPGGATGLDQIRTEGVNGKVLLNGVLYILRDGKMYNVQGAQVR